MGTCFSANAMNSGEEVPTAKVVCIDGSLMEFSAPVEVSEVLGLDGLSLRFVCDSDSLRYDDYIQALSPRELVVPGKLYFVLPVDMLKRVLLGPEMAALAVKASPAFADDHSRSRKRRSAGMIRVMPFAGEAGVGVRSSGPKMGGRRFEAKLRAIHEADE